MPSNTEANPRRDGKGQCQAITLRSGKNIAGTEHRAPAPELQVEAARPREEKTVTAEKENLENSEVQHEEKDKVGSVEKPRSSVPIVHPPVPYPQRLNKQREDKQFNKFLEEFKKLQINIPFAEAL